MQGWIKLHRKLKEWEWYKDANMKQLFIHILISANHKENKWRGITIGKGQLLSGRNVLASDTGLSVQTIRTCIKRLISTNEITMQVTKQYSIITVLNWDAYQHDENDTNQANNQVTNPQLTNDQPSSNQVLTTNKKEENGKKVKKEKKKEEETHPLQIFISENLPNVSKLKTQMTEKNCIDILGKFHDAELIKSTLENMENHEKTAKKKYSSVYLTLKNWLSKDFQRTKLNGNGSPQHNSYNKTDEQRQKRIDHIKSNSIQV